MDIQKEKLIAEIENFKTEILKIQVVKVWAESHSNSDPFKHVILEKEDCKVWWMEAQAHQLWETWLAAKAQGVPEGFVLVPVGHNKFFSHDFNGDGFQYHDTLQEAKNAAEADLDIYRDRVADGNHIAEMGEFNELAYGIVVGQAEWSVDCVVSADDHKNGEYTQYDIGTEILSLYLSEAQEPAND
ncbi:hypothetical protein [Acinetobacter sp. CWB-B33]|uniref:hypothetical protein n=1 Tax=Acinetobacter sp. CWB-B33 TaxID=2815724 RepID=UPI0031FEC9D8